LHPAFAAAGVNSAFASLAAFPTALQFQQGTALAPQLTLASSAQQKEGIFHYNGLFQL
jgi:hypothetical protein